MECIHHMATYLRLAIAQNKGKVGRHHNYSWSHIPFTTGDLVLTTNQVLPRKSSLLSAKIAAGQ